MSRVLGEILTEVFHQSVKNDIIYVMKNIPNQFGPTKYKSQNIVEKIIPGEKLNKANKNYVGCSPIFF